MNDDGLIKIILHLLLIVAMLFGFCCFIVVMKFGLTAIYEQYGAELTIFLGVACVIGLLPIGFLFDKAVAREKALAELRERERHAHSQETSPR